MGSLLTPQRRRGYEILDDPEVDPYVRKRSLDDVARSNTIFGGSRAVRSELDSAIRASAAREISVLDVGTGIGDILGDAKKQWRARGVNVEAVGIDNSETLLRFARADGLVPLCADALALPLASKSVDVVICSQMLHHFERDNALIVLRELDRVARRRVIVSDIRRSWLAAAGIWLASFPLRFHPVSRHDGVVSVLRGFTPTELGELVSVATRHRATTHRRLGFRATASWSPTMESVIA